MFKDRLEALIEEMSQSGIAYGEAMQEFRKIFISRVLQQSNGNQIRAAQKLGMHRNTLKRNMTQLQIVGGRTARKKIDSQRLGSAALRKTG